MCIGLPVLVNAHFASYFPVFNSRTDLGVNKMVLGRGMLKKVLMFQPCCRV